MAALDYNFERGERNVEAEVLYQRIAELEQGLQDQVDEYVACLARKLELERENAELKARMK